MARKKKTELKKEKKKKNPYYHSFHENFTPGTNIKIISENDFSRKKVDYLLVLPWHFKNHILKKEKKFINNNGKFIFPLPDIEII